MNVEIGAEAAQFPEKEHINRIAVAVHLSGSMSTTTKSNIIFFTIIVPCCDYIQGEAEEAEERAGLTEQAVAKVKSAARGAM
jgi:hypothetical protein